MKNSTYSSSSGNSTQCFVSKLDLIPKIPDIPHIPGIPFIQEHFQKKIPQIPQLPVIPDNARFMKRNIKIKLDEIPNIPFIPHIPGIPFISEQLMKKIPQISSIQFTVKFQKQNFKTEIKKKLFQNSDYSIILGGSI